MAREVEVEVGEFAIAIVGMALRVPGARTVEQFWLNLRAGIESIRRFGREELIAAGVSSAEVDAPDFVPANGVLEDIDRFDAEFFNVTPREAALMDPQHRVFLECAWQALEDAGEVPERCRGEIGVFAGAGLSTYLLRNLGGDAALRGTSSGLPALLGNDKDHVATRVAYKLNLSGPALGVQTACSSSLVAVHMAARALLGGECEVALAGGVSITVPQVAGYRFEEGGIYSPDGHCRAFDAGARGTVGGNGAGVVVLKRLPEALRDGNAVRAVIRGSAVNNDGSSKIGYTAPSVERQAEVIRAAQIEAEVAAGSIGMIEAHGTGTPLGDLVELEALRRAFGDVGQRQQACALGSVKTNIGHLDAAAGVVGLIKTVLALERGEIPPSLHFQRADPRTGLDKSPFFVPTEVRPWSSDHGPRRAGVSSFGMGGTNVHVVLEQPPPQSTSPMRRDDNLLTLSARSADSLGELAGGLSRFLEDNPAVDLADVTYTLQMGRREFPVRRSIVAVDAAEACAALGRNLETAACVAQKPAIAFLFPGQGAQYSGMAQALYDAEPVFRTGFDRCLDSLDRSLAVVLRELLLAKGVDGDRETQLAQTHLAQPAIFIVEWALAQLLMSWGLQPDILLGHSLGEYVAATLGGAMQLADAVPLVAARGRLIAELPPGSMMAVDLPASALEARFGERVDVAAENEIGRSVLSGNSEVVAQLQEALIQEGVACQLLVTSHAFHSSMMEPGLPAMVRLLEGIELSEPATPWLSNVSGDWIEPAASTDPNYWAAHLRRRVRFADCLARLLDRPEVLLFEVGPGRSLTGMAKRHPAWRSSHRAVEVMGRADREGQERRALLEAVGQAWSCGAELDWSSLWAGERRRRVSLPTTPFERGRFWVEEATSPPTTSPRHGRLPPTDWFWTPSWHQIPYPTHRLRRENRNVAQWLVFTDEGPLGSLLIETLRQRAAKVTEVRWGRSTRQLAAGLWTVAPDAPDGFSRLFEQIGADGPSLRIVDLWGADRSPRSDAPELDLHRSFYPYLELARAWTGQPYECDLELITVTCGAWSVTGAESMVPETALKVGLARAMAQELPRIATRVLDLDQDCANLDRQAVWIADECSVAGRYPLIAWRGEHAWVLSFDQIEVPLAEPGSLEKGAVCLIVGGLGGVGLEIAHVLARSYEARLVLVSRSAPQEPASGFAARSRFDGARSIADQLAEIEAEGGEVHLAAGDVADRESLGSVFRRTKERFGRIDLVIHAAAAPLLLRSVSELRPKDCEPILRPKVAGLQNLGAVATEYQPRACVVISSLASVLGAVGFSAYAAAHGFMDSWVQSQSRSSGPKWSTLNWDNWYTSKTWPAEGREIAEEFYLSPAEGREAFTRLLGIPSPGQLLISTGDLQARRERWITGSSTAARAIPGMNVSARPGGRTEAIFAPESSIETTLARLWGEVLGLEAIGVQDDFFDLGGDSVSALQIVSAASQAGLKIKMRDLFQYPTIAELATVITPPQPTLTIRAEESPHVPLSPMQKWFFAQKRVRPHHFNMVRRVEVPANCTPDLVGDALDRLVARHDAFHFRFESAAEGKVEIESCSRCPLRVVDVVADSEAAEAAVRREVRHAHQTIDLTSGPLLQGVLVRKGHDPGELFLIAHHLVVDVWSWKVLLEELGQLLQAGLRGAEPELPPLGATFAAWCRRVDARGNDLSEEEKVYWRRILARGPFELPKDTLGPNTEGSVATVFTHVESNTAERILIDLRRSHRLSPEVVVLAALTRALGEWTGRGSVIIDIEGDGRQVDLGADLDVSRTVGWFTSLFPLSLDLATPDVLEEVAKTRDLVREVPDEGLGYGSWRFGRSDAPLPAVSSEVSFVYLGAVDEESMFNAQSVRSEWEVGSAAPEQQRSHVLQVVVRVQESKLQIESRFSRNLHRVATIERLHSSLISWLEQIVASCLQGAMASSERDFPDSGLDEEQMARLLSELESLDSSE